MGDLGSIPGLGRSPGEGKGHPPQRSGLGLSCCLRAFSSCMRGCYSAVSVYSLQAATGSLVSGPRAQLPHSTWNLPGLNPRLHGLNPGLPHCRQTFYRLNHQGSLTCHNISQIRKTQGVYSTKKILFICDSRSPSKCYKHMLEIISHFCE